MFPRTLELLDQYDLYDSMAQVGFVVRAYVNYNQDGQVVTPKARSPLNSADDSFLNQMLDLRLKYSEEIIQAAYEKLGGRVIAPWEVIDFSITESPADSHPVLIRIQNHQSREISLLRGKYLIGTDGARATIRKMASISAVTDETEYRFARIDAVVETNIPNDRFGAGLLQSKTHGSILFVCLDHGATRIGYSVDSHLFAKYGGNMTTEDILNEAKVALLPWRIEFKQVDWTTVYR